MTTPQFLQFLESATGTPPATLSPQLQVLWLVKIGNWQDAHDIAQDLPEPNGAWLHGYLHRIEGDLPNASYWYHRANQPTPSQSLSHEDEWRQLVSHFCQDSCQ